MTRSLSEGRRRGRLRSSAFRQLCEHAHGASLACVFTWRVTRHRAFAPSPSRFARVSSPRASSRLRFPRPRARWVTSLPPRRAPSVATTRRRHVRREGTSRRTTRCTPRARAPPSPSDSPRRAPHDPFVSRDTLRASRRHPHPSATLDPRARPLAGHLTPPPRLPDRRRAPSGWPPRGRAGRPPTGAR